MPRPASMDTRFKRSISWLWAHRLHLCETGHIAGNVVGLICGRQFSHEAPFFEATCTDHWKVSLHSETLAGE